MHLTMLAATQPQMWYQACNQQQQQLPAQPADMPAAAVLLLEERP
jgi:hypothetical protein